jgi:hypothetical protein
MARDWPRSSSVTEHYCRKDYQLARQWQMKREEERLNRLKRLQNRGVSKNGHAEERLENLRREIQLPEQEEKPRI